MRDNTSIRVSRSIKDLAFKVIQFKEKYNKDHLREPTIEEIAKELDVTKEDISFSLDAIQDPISLQEPVYNDGTDNIYVMDQVGDNNSDIDWIDEILLKKSLKELPDREKKILAMRFMQGMTQTEVAKEIGISQAQVSRLEKGALDKVKSHRKVVF